MILDFFASHSSMCRFFLNDLDHHGEFRSAFIKFALFDVEASVQLFHKSSVWSVSRLSSWTWIPNFQCCGRKGREGHRSGIQVYFQLGREWRLSFDVLLFKQLHPFSYLLAFLLTCSPGQSISSSRYMSSAIVISGGHASWITLSLVL